MANPHHVSLLPELIARQVARTPDAVAVVDAGRALSYAELDRRANQLAHRLLELGGGPDRLVAVCLRRSVDVVVALVGAWRAGMAYVPLDPDHPRERLVWQLAETGAETVLTERALEGRVRGAGATAVCLDADRELFAAAPVGVPHHADGAAYAIYTSGSTGRPKGVVVTHAGIANRVLWTVRTHRLSGTDRVLQKTALTFDAAGWEIFAPLVSGGTVVMAPAGVERDPGALVRAVADHRITVLQLVPSVLRLLVDEPDWDGCDRLRLVFSAGEPLQAELCQRLLERVKVEVWNTYGPTECAIDVTAHRFDPMSDAGPVPIGRPIDNIRVRVLDAAGDPVPVGVPGELHVGGVGLARGYLDRPELTADRFVPDRSGPPGSRLYRTGDLVTWHHDGSLSYLRRLDDQLKVNGVRVEPAEVEAALLRHPDVHSAAVKGFADRSGATRLAAYVLSRDVAEPESLREFLRDQLPAPIVPSVILALDGFPTTTSGKLDRSALPSPDTAPDRPAYRPPGTPAERLVSEVWSRLLGAERVGVDDSFFQLGGSSLLITRLAAELSAAAGRQVAVPDLFYAPTVAEQARLVETAPAPAAPIPPVPRGRPVPLSFGQRRQWALDRMQPGSREWVAPMFVRLPETFEPVTVSRSLDALVARHEVLRTRYVTVAGGEPMQVIDEPHGIELRVADTAEPELPALFAKEFAEGFDLERGPLLRAVLVRVPGQPQLLLLTMHHITCDGWSTVVLERELRELCAAHHEGRRPELARPPIQYADFASWQRDWLTGEVQERELSYWRTALSGLAPLELPIDRPRPEEWDARGGLVPFEVPPELAERVVELGRRHDATAFMTLLTAYAVLLSRYSGQLDVPVGVPVAGRTHPQTADVVGFFLNSLVFRCELSGAPSFVEALGRVRDMSLSGFAHQSLPFEALVDDLAPERDLSRTPLYQVEFDMHEAGWTGTTPDAASLAAFESSWRVAKSDLCLYLQRRDDGSMAGAVEYARALFDPGTIERFADHYVRLLAAVTDDPSIRLPAVQFLAPSERDQLLRHAADGAPVRVLDGSGNLAPIGVPGEIHIGGTATGEIGRWRPDGSLEQQGRVGQLVAIRGMPVDPGRVAAVLVGHPAVDEVVITAYRAGLAGIRLRAWWTSPGGPDRPAPSSEELAAYCGARLPDHQVPAEFVRLARIPRTSDGELDHDALTRTGGSGGQAPQSIAGERVAEIWAELLGVEVPVAAGFFGLGGNSILAIQMIARIREEFGVEVPVREFFEQPTVARVAELVEEGIRAELAGLSDLEVLAQIEAGQP
jgi:amino acid adenylation domain-containing protein